MGMDRRELYKILDEFFNDSELRKLCFGLGINYKDLAGPARTDKARELIQYCERREMLAQLEAAMRRARPHALWADAPSAAPLAQPTKTTFDMRGAKIGKQVIVQGNYIDQSVNVKTARRPTGSLAVPSAGTETFGDLEIRIRKRQERGYPVEMILDGLQVFPPGHLADILPWASTGDPTADGQRLFDALLADSVLRSNWTEARGQSPRRRIRLWLDVGTPELHTLPWETMRENHVVLAADADTPFSRFLPVQVRWSGPVGERPIRVLVAISNPRDLYTRYNLPPANVELERRALEAAFATVSQTLLQVEYLKSPVTLERLEQKLREGRHHILHFLGHGAFDSKQGRAALYLQDVEGNASRVLDKDLASMLARQGVQPHLVLMAACHGATRSAADAFMGLGPKLVEIGVPAVVAMQDVVSVETARTFSAKFYERLLEHGQVDLAANEARSTLLTAGRLDAAVPVLFMRLKSGQLWDAKAADLG